MFTAKVRKFIANPIFLVYHLAKIDFIKLTKIEYTSNLLMHLYATFFLNYIQQKAYFFIFIQTYSWAINWLINVYNGCYTLLLHEKQHVSMHDRTLLVSYISPDVSRYIKNAFFHMFANVAHKNVDWLLTIISKLFSATKLLSFQNNLFFFYFALSWYIFHFKCFYGKIGSEEMQNCTSYKFNYFLKFLRKCAQCMLR